MAIAQCTLLIEKPEELTVGVPFLLHCDESILSLQKPELRIDPQNQYDLKLLGPGPTGQDFLVTSLRAGQHTIHAAQFVDAQQSLLIPDLQFSVKSVLDPKNPKAEPFGPLGPLKLGMSPVFWAVLASLSVMLLGALIYFLSRILKRQANIKAMRTHWGSQQPLAELSLGLRRLKKRMETDSAWTTLLPELKILILIFMAREIGEPIFQTKSLQQGSVQVDEKFLQTFLRKTKQGPKLERVLSEIESLQIKPEGVKWADAEQILEMARKLCDETYSQIHASTSRTS